MALTKVTGSVIKDSVSLSGNVSVGGTLTYQDVTNVDALGIGTFRTGINVSGGQVDVGSNIKLGNAGVITATSFSGVMSGTTGSFSGQVNVGSNIKLGTAGVVTATSFVGSGANLTSLPSQLTLSNNADNRVITGGSGTNLNGEANLTFDGTYLNIGTTDNTPLAVGGISGALSTSARANITLKTGASDGAANTGSGLLFFNHAGTGHFFGGSLQVLKENGTSGNTASLMRFCTRPNGGSVTEALRITSDGHIGVGGAPSAWQASSNTNVLQLGTACLFNYNNDYFHLGQNFYYDGNYKYVVADHATRLLQDNGKFTFYRAVSGSADATITWLESLIIDDNGRAVIGHTQASTNYGKLLHIHNSASAGASVHLTDSTTGTSNSDGFELVMHNQAAYLVQREPSAMIFMTNGTNERLRLTSGGQVNIGTNGALKAEINNSVGGHYFVSQCDDNQNGFEIYQQHGATHTRAPFAVYDNKTGSKDLSFKIDGAGWTYHNTTSNGTTNGNVDKRYNWGSTNNLNFGMHLSTRQRYAIWEHRQGGRTSPRTAQISTGENGYNQGTVICYSSTANADVTGGVHLTNGATSWSGNSDMRLKNKTGDILNALEDINKIEPLKFTWKYGADNNPHVGVSAQSVENVVPEAIDRGVDVERQREGDETEYMKVRYTELIPLSIAAIKELKAEVESLKAEIASLKSS